MELQDLLIDGIEFLESLPESEENTARLQLWQNHLNQLNTSSTTPKCPTGYYWDGNSCTKDVG